MAYQLVFYRFENGDPAPVNSARLRSVLGAHGIMAPEHEYVELTDGLSVEIHVRLAEETTEEVLLEFSGTSDVLFQLVFALMVAGPMTALVVDEPTTPLLTDAALSAHLPDGDLAEPVVCNSWHDVATAILPPFETWADWAGV